MFRNLSGLRYFPRSCNYPFPFTHEELAGLSANLTKPHLRSTVSLSILHPFLLLQFYQLTTRSSHSDHPPPLFSHHLAHTKPAISITPNLARHLILSAFPDHHHFLPRFTNSLKLIFPRTSCQTSRFHPGPSIIPSIRGLLAVFVPVYRQFLSAILIKFGYTNTCGS